MKKVYLLKTAALVLVCSSGCQSRPAGVWDNDSSTETTAWSERSFWGEGSGQNQALSDREFLGPSREEFIPLCEDDLQLSHAEKVFLQPTHAPGDPASGLPHISQFRQPSELLASIFRTVYFGTDEHVLNDKEYINVINRIAAYLKEHPNTYVVLAGHCDQRGPAAYNLALGTRRSNHVRSLLLQRGVRNEQLHTVSYGKEQLADSANNRLAWSKNRRVEFKIHQKG